MLGVVYENRRSLLFRTPALASVGQGVRVRGTLAVSYTRATISEQIICLCTLPDPVTISTSSAKCCNAALFDAVFDLFNEV